MSVDSPHVVSFFAGLARSFTAPKHFMRSFLVYLTGLCTQLLLSKFALPFTSISWSTKPTTFPRTYHFGNTSANPSASFGKYHILNNSSNHASSTIALAVANPRSLHFSKATSILSVYHSVVTMIDQASSMDSVFQFLIFFALIFVSVKMIQHLRLSIGFQVFTRRNACLPIRLAPNPFPWKLRRYFELSKIDANLLDDYLLKKYQTSGMTHGLATVLTKTVKAVATIEPENFQAVLATRFDDWERPKFRAGAAKPFLKTGILTLDGPHWAYSRKIMKSQFTRKQIDDNLAASERHLQDLFLGIGKIDYNGWTESKDLMDLFFRFAMDSSTEFMFGLSASTALCGLAREGKVPPTSETVSMDGFEEAFKRVQKHVGVRMKMGRSYWMIDGWDYRKACADLVAIKDPFIAAAIEIANKRLTQNKGQATNVIEALVAEGHNFDYISNQCRHLIIAGFETTSALLGFSFALIERHPEVLSKLRDTVLTQFGTEGMPLQPLNFETLKNCKYLQWVIFETLRLYPAGPSIQRVAVRDTVLPRGGGPDGTAPTAIPKGSTVQLGIYLSHRRKDIWGEDAAEFRPERWEGRKKGYDFIPFIAGPQICLGQQYSMTQAAFVIARFFMRFDAMEKPIGQDNLRKGWQTVLSPGNGVKLKFRLGSDKRAVNLLSFLN